MCGVVAVWDHAEAANLAYLGLHALQHRGQESAGVVSADAGRLHAVTGMGHVADVVGADALATLPGRAAIGHVRYTTAGGSSARNAQPLVAQVRRRPIALAHNGNLVNAGTLRRQLEDDGAIFAGDSDTEVVLQLLARSAERDIVDRLAAALGRVRGAYSLVVATDEHIVAARDPHGFRPLVLGRIDGPRPTWVVASETCAFELIGAERVRDIEPGELLAIGAEGLRSVRLPQRAEPARCVFEYVYFARPDSVLDDGSVYEARVRMGERLFAEHAVDADVVIPVPDSGVVAALGYARASGLPFELGLIRNHYVGRTFIEPKDSIRHFGVKLKLSPVPGLLRGRRVVVIDDSLVRGTTSRKIVKMIRDAGAAEVHVRISSPPVISPCFYGIDTPTRAELIASTHDPDEVARYITADTLRYLSPEGLLGAVRPGGGEAHCTACFTGRYPVPFDGDGARRQLRLIDG
jgi:amidophosphoribosyltransferase